MTVAQPLVFLDPLTAASFTTAGGLVLTAASGATATIPTGALVLGGIAAKKAVILKALAASREEPSATRQPSMWRLPFFLSYPQLQNQIKKSRNFQIKN